jgi:hypothetical protein
MGLTNSRAGATRVTLEEKRRRYREFALEDGVSIALLLFSSCILNRVYVAEYARVHQRRGEEDLDLDREWRF